MTFYFRPIPLPSTQQVNNLAYLFKKGRVERSMLTTFNLWKGRGRGRKQQAGSVKIIDLSPWRGGHWVQERSHLGQICDILTTAS
jgi:hypothetical protein